MQLFTLSRFLTYSCSLLLFLLLCCCSAKEPIHNNMVLPDDDVAIGQKIDEAFLYHLDTVPDQEVLAESDHPALYSYLQNLCNLIQNNPLQSSAAADPGYPVPKPILRILNAPNKTGAFVAPGGYIYIYTGLLKKLDYEAEIVPILAHLTYCSSRRYAVKKLEDHFSTNFLLDLAIGGNVNGNYASASANVCAVIDHLENKPYEVQQVKILDELSEDAACQMGYDIQLYSDLFMNNAIQDLDWFQLFQRNISNNGYATHLSNNVKHPLSCNGNKSSEGYPAFKALIP